LQGPVETGINFAGISGDGDKLSPCSSLGYQDFSFTRRKKSTKGTKGPNSESSMDHVFPVTFTLEKGKYQGNSLMTMLSLM